MACPFFMPTEKLENGMWLHAHRLPLGCGWSGQCMAPGHEGEAPSEHELGQFCNLGYADGCSRMPQQREWDSIRFAARTIGTAESCIRIQLRYICERGHLPAEHGLLEFDASENQWATRHRDSRVQRMAECFLATYREGRRNQELKLASAS